MHPDEQHAHWQETMRLHMQVYARPVSQLIRVLDAGKVEAAVRPMTAAATALAGCRRWDPFYDGTPLEGMLGLRLPVPPVPAATTTSMLADAAAVAGDSSGLGASYAARPASTTAAAPVQPRRVGDGASSAAVAGSAAAAWPPTTLIPIDVDDEEEPDDAAVDTGAACSATGSRAARAGAVSEALCGVVHEALARFHQWERLELGLDGQGLRHLVIDMLRASCSTVGSGAAVSGTSSGAHVQWPTSAAPLASDGAAAGCGPRGAVAASHDRFEALLTQGITVSGDADGTDGGDINGAAECGRGLAAVGAVLPRGGATGAGSAAAAAEDTDVAMAGVAPAVSRVQLVRHPPLRSRLPACFTSQDLLPLVLECAPPPFLEALGLLVPASDAHAASGTAGGTAGRVPSGYAVAAGAAAAVHAALEQLQQQGRVIAVDAPLDAPPRVVAPPAVDVPPAAASLTQASAGSLPSSQCTIPASPTRSVDEDDAVAAQVGDPLDAAGSGADDEAAAAPPRVEGRTIVQHVLLALAAKHEAGGNAVHAAAARGAAGLHPLPSSLAAAPPVGGAVRPPSVASPAGKSAGLDQHFVVVSVPWVVAPCVVALMQHPSPAVVARSKALGVGRAASAVDARRNRHAAAPAIARDGGSSGSEGDEDDDASAARTASAAAGISGAGGASIADAARQQLLDLWTMSDLMAALTASVPLRRVPHAAVATCMARLQDANCVIAVGRDRYLIDHAAGL